MGGWVDWEGGSGSVGGGGSVEIAGRVFIIINGCYELVLLK